jgi:hypothetical protein
VGLAVHDNETPGTRRPAWQSLIAVSPLGGMTGGGGGSVVDVVVDPGGVLTGDVPPTVVVGIEGIEPDVTVVVGPVPLVPPRAG